MSISISTAQELETGTALGTGAYKWMVTPTHVDLSMPSAPQRPVTVKAEPQHFTIDLNRTAIVVVDMQNDFCARGGWLDAVGTDLTPERAPIAPLQAILPVLRDNKVPVIWVNWGNRPDRKNLAPTVQYVFNTTGSGYGIGGELPNGKGRVLEKGSWSAATIDELKEEAGDIHVDKYRISGFWDTPLDSILRNLDVRTILFAGVNTDQCVMHTLTDAHFHGYNCVMVEDCCGTTSPDYCVQASIFNVKLCFGFVASSSAIIAAIKAQ